MKTFKDIMTEKTKKDYVKKGLYSEDGKKVNLERQSKYVFGAEDEEGYIDNMSWKNWLKIDAPIKISDFAQNEFINILLSKIKKFGNKVEYNSWIKKNESASFEVKINKIISIDSSIKIPKSGVKR